MSSMKQYNTSCHCVWPCAFQSNPFFCDIKFHEGQLPVIHKLWANFAPQIDRAPSVQANEIQDKRVSMAVG